MAWLPGSWRDNGFPRSPCVPGGAASVTVTCPFLVTASTWPLVSASLLLFTMRWRASDSRFGNHRRHFPCDPSWGGLWVSVRRWQSVWGAGPCLAADLGPCYVPGSLWDDRCIHQGGGMGCSHLGACRRSGSLGGTALPPRGFLSAAPASWLGVDLHAVRVAQAQSPPSVQPPSGKLPQRGRRLLAAWRESSRHALRALSQAGAGRWGCRQKKSVSSHFWGPSQDHFPGSFLPLQLLGSRCPWLVAATSPSASVLMRPLPVSEFLLRSLSH